MVNYPKKVAGPGGFLRCGGGGGGRHSSVFGLLIFLHLWIKIDAAARPGAPEMLITNDDTSATGMHILPPTVQFTMYIPEACLLKSH